VILTPAERAAVERQAVEEYPNEACGVVLARAGERRLLRCRNAQNELHAQDPQRYPRDARSAYHIADQDRLAMVRLEQQGFAPVVIYHSHVDAGAYFSETDKRQALIADEPIYPDAIYVVLSVVRGRVKAMGAFRWDADRRDFLPVSSEKASTAPSDTPSQRGPRGPLRTTPEEGCPGEAGTRTS
jgi:proteasome lid subunit RPN8/RPN11